VRTGTCLVLLALLGCGGGGGGGPSFALLQLEGTSYTCNEGDGTVTIAVHRTIRTRGEVTVDYATVDGTAVGGEDFIATSGTLTWPDEDTDPRTITIPLIDEGCREGDETLDVVLSNPTGKAKLGVRTSARLTIQDAPWSGSLIEEISYNPSPQMDDLIALAMDDTFIYIAGFDADPGQGDWQWRIEKRYLQDYRRDNLFGNSGIVRSNPSVLDDSALVITIDSTHLYVGGYDEVMGSGDWQWRIEKRYLDDGSLDPTFGTAGAVTSNPSRDWDDCYGVEVDGTSIYAIGIDESPAPGDWQWRIEKRSIQDGTLDPQFGSGGIVTTNPSPGDDGAWSILNDGTHLYIGGWDESPGSWQWRIEKRDAGDGSLDPGFGAGGIITSDPSSGSDECYALVADGTFLYAAGSDSVPGGIDSEWRLEKRRLTDGTLDVTFGLSGIVSVNPGIYGDHATDLALDVSFIYIIGYDEEPGLGDKQWRIEKRLAADGSLDPCFGSIPSNPSPGFDSPSAIGVGDTYIHIVGSDMSASPGDTGHRIEKRIK
jgi:uncharacterized delta-60 repeat protein